MSKISTIFFKNTTLCEAAIMLNACVVWDHMVGNKFVPSTVMFADSTIEKGYTTKIDNYDFVFGENDTKDYFINRIVKPQCIVKIITVKKLLWFLFQFF